jgi:SAM-dependent methyltransferase
MARLSPSPAQQAYDPMASYYDTFSSHHDYELWLSHLLPALEGHGLRGRRLLDVGCGTGKSFEPLLDSDWQITACDVSAEMLEQAAVRGKEQVRLEIADMRALPVLGPFDLVWALGDVVNYLLQIEDVELALHGMAANLTDDGLLLFDTNTVLSHRTLYGETEIKEQDGKRLVWQGRASADARPGGEVQAMFEVQDRYGATLCRALHRQRHYRAKEIESVLNSAGLELLAVYGQGFDAVLQQPVDETRHTKAVFIAKRHPEH